MRTALLLTGLLAVSVAATVFGATWYVDDSVSSSGDGKSWATAFKNIQQAINASSDGDTVMVAQGTYVENIQFKGKNIILTSADPLNPTVVANTIIDGNQAGSVVTFCGTETGPCMLSGFTVQNGNAVYGGGVCGGGYSCRAHATIWNNRITGNSAGSGGGLAWCDGPVQGNTITGNSAEGEGGGLVYCGGPVRDNVITGNSTVWEGGGLYGCQGTIENNVITGNSTVWEGGGGLSGCPSVIRNNTITDNSAGYDGGGLRNCDGTIENNTITGNAAGAGGGGLSDCDGTIQNNTITANVAWGWDGGGLSDCDGTIQNNRIMGNSAVDGGGLSGCLAVIQDNTITGNSATYNGGGLAYCDGTIQNDTIAGNSAVWGASGALVFCNGTIRNCIIWGNTALYGGELQESSIPTYSCIEGWSGGGEGNIAPPSAGFVDADGPDNDPASYQDNNYRLSAGSPCIDAGTNEEWMWSATDLDGNMRVFYGGKSRMVDMGSYEYGSFPFRVVGVENTALDERRLTWSSREGYLYVVWSSTDLISGAWTQEQTVPSAGTSTSWTDSSRSVPRKFYKVELK